MSGAARQAIRSAARRMGVDLRRYPQHDPQWNVAQLLISHDVQLVLDVGAHEGHYAQSLRQFGYRGSIRSFEPLSEPFARLREKALSEQGWTAWKYAIGAEASTVTVNVSANRAASSSVLGILPRTTGAVPDARYVGTEEVEQKRLDDLCQSIAPDQRAFLKADVQGYERNVLDGASALLQEQIVGMQLELSFVPLYEGGMDWREGFDRAESLGMQLMYLTPEFVDPETGQLLQVDAVFFRL